MERRKGNWVECVGEVYKNEYVTETWSSGSIHVRPGRSHIAYCRPQRSVSIRVTDSSYSRNVVLVSIYEMLFSFQFPA
jgi:hypothetical protein